MKDLSFKLLLSVFIIAFISQACNYSKKNSSKTNEANSTENRNLKVGYLPISAALPLFVAIEKELFKEQGINVEMVKYQNGALMAEDVLSGRIIAACPGPADIYLSKEVEQPGRFKIYLQTAYTPSNFMYSILVKKVSGIKTMKDLKGKKIGVFPGVTNKLLLEVLLKDMFGWEPDKDIIVQGVSAPLQLDALETGEYDAICPLEPTGTIGSFRKNIVMIEKGPIEKNVLNPLYITLHALSTKALKENPELVNKFVLAMGKAVDLIREDEQAMRAILPKYTSLTLEQSRLTPIGNCVKTNEASRADFQKLIDLLVSKGVLSKKIDANTLYLEVN
ncbi:MAG: ABC transporter substrate-binding protein [Bacteroidales bacterium]|nr:ABC transporter substrate-binding protein [Bacteroidales bacterium]